MKYIILKTACLLISIGQLNAQNSLGKTDDSGRIVLNVSLEEEIIDKSVTKIFENRLKRIVSLNGFGGNKSYPRFVITGDVDELTKEVASTTNPLYVLTLNFNFYIGDAIAGTVFSSESIEINGVGRTYQKAYIAAIKKINPKNKIIQNFVTKGKNRIIEYYNSRCDFILTEAKKEANTRKFDSAIYRLTEVPEVCKECFNKSMDLAVQIFSQKIELECEQNIASAKSNIAADNWDLATEKLALITPDLKCYNKAADILKSIENHRCSVNLSKAKGAYAARNYDAAAKFLGSVSSDSGCYESSKSLFNNLVAKTDEIDRRNFSLQYEKYNRDQELKEREMSYKEEKQFELEKLRLKSMRDIGVSYGENQPRTTTRIINPN